MGENCANCGVPLAGYYCHDCGQKRVERGDLRLGRLLEQFVEALTNLDSRFWRSLRMLLFRPGRLTSEYLAGRRARYMAPVSLFIIANVLYFVAPGITDFELRFYEHIDGELRVMLVEESRELTPTQREQIADYRAQAHSRWTGTWVLQRIAARDAAAQERHPQTRYTLGDYEAAYDQRRGEVSRLLIILHVPFLALLLLLAHPRHGFTYAEHFVSALHLFAFMIFFVELVILPGSLIGKAAGLGEVPAGVKWGVVVVLVSYAGRALQVTYGRPFWLSLPVALLVLTGLGWFSLVVYRALQFAIIFLMT
ncbi:MAG TPA: DUF3667 domain-containing protein [Xanthomonadaceae bacterium]|nr:DUF3667 domain-containing protein [Xanthomonadaceae bacterium]